MSGALLGVDAGGTHTRAVIRLGRQRGQVVEAGPANWTTLGPDRSARTIAESIARVLGDARLPASALSGACVALAGYYPPWHEAEVRAAMDAMLPGIPMRVVPDLVAAWAGATGGEPGIALSAGTGAVAYGQDAAGNPARAGGWGPLFGDEGGGYWIGMEALRAVARSIDGRGPATDLSTLILQLSAHAETSLRAVYRDGWTREQVAALSREVARAAEADDAVAREILERAAAELGALVLAVARRLEWGSGRIPVFAVGGLFEAGAPLRTPIERWLAAVLPSARWEVPLGPPLDGALRLAREAACRNS